MNCQEVLKKLKSFGSSQFCKTFARHGVRGPMYGVSYKHLGTLTKQLQPNHKLALELWATGNHDARILATMIAEPTKLTGPIAESWLKDLDNYVIGDAFAGLVSKSPVAHQKASKWRASKREWISSAGWSVTSRLAGLDSNCSDRQLADRLVEIEARIHSAPNRTRHAMNSTLINIGLRNVSLRKLALAAAKRIGKVGVDHGDTSCQTQDAAAYIKKTVAYYQQKKKAKSR